MTKSKEDLERELRLSEAKFTRLQAQKEEMVKNKDALIEQIVEKAESQYARAALLTERAGVGQHRELVWEGIPSWGQSLLVCKAR